MLMGAARRPPPYLPTRSSRDPSAAVLRSLAPALLQPVDQRAAPAGRPARRATDRPQVTPVRPAQGGQREPGSRQHDHEPGHSDQGALADGALDNESQTSDDEGGGDQ